MTRPDLFTLADPNFSVLLTALILLFGVVAPLVYAARGLWRMRGRR